MEKVNEILNNIEYKKYLKALEEIEKDREFCKHNIEHFLDLARIAYIIVLENKLPFSKEIIYGIALLHDIGRVLEYTETQPHHEASIIISKKILKDSKYTTDEINSILKAIGNHRDNSDDELSNVIYVSDKLSRNCFNCKAEKECYWKNEKKNFKIIY